jgi:hypothetical protein
MENQKQTIEEVKKSSIYLDIEEHIDELMYDWRCSTPHQVRESLGYYNIETIVALLSFFKREKESFLDNLEIAKSVIIVAAVHKGIFVCT